MIQKILYKSFGAGPLHISLSMFCMFILISWSLFFLLYLPSFSFLLTENIEALPVLLHLMTTLEIEQSFFKFQMIK